MNFKKEFEGEAKAIITDAFIFTDFKQGELPDLKFFTHVAAWDTGAEHTSLSMEVIEALQLKPVGYDTIAVFGGVKEAGLYQVSIGLPNATILHNMIVYGADLDEYSMLIGMDIIRRTDFLITNADGKTTFQFRTPSEGGETLTLTATVAPDDATDKTVTWATSDAAVATVADGVVTAVGAGTATITATATNGTDDTGDDKTATCTVTVSPAKYAVTVKDGTEDATNWTITPSTAIAGETVTVTYSGTKKVKSVKAKKK